MLASREKYLVKTLKNITLLATSLQVELPNLEAGIAAAQEADVFVGMHGGQHRGLWLA